jgi:hypothetical protein
MIVAVLGSGSYEVTTAGGSEDGLRLAREPAVLHRREVRRVGRQPHHLHLDRGHRRLDLAGLMRPQVIEQNDVPLAQPRGQRETKASKQSVSTAPLNASVETTPRSPMLPISETLVPRRRGTRCTTRSPRGARP